MDESREVHAYAYVNRPYDEVIDTLQIDAIGVFQRATASAAARARSIVTTMHADVGPIELGVDVLLRVRAIERTSGPMGPTTVLRLVWEATKSPELFPTMDATLSVYPLAPGDTQLDFAGAYRPPLGPLGAAIDAVVGHRIAQATVARFVDDVAERLKVDVAP